MSRERTGRVLLVGAGPGDPDLITLRGVRALERADVVLYDDLANPALLDLAPRAALRINVGKRGHDAPTQPQDAIEALMLSHARDGKCVVRLKGGDPFVFGRGGEEASACADAGIPVEVVPGISAAIAAPAYAGIPVTDRRHSASFAVVTGHKDPTRVREETRWRELARAVDTIVILMGMRNLGEIVERLLEGGRSRSTPTAAVQWGTIAQQRVVTAPLAEIVARVAEAGLGAPAAIVVGDVVGLREQLAWFEARPLFGMRVLVTRAAEQAEDLAKPLREVGALPVLAPMIRLEPPEDTAALDRALAQLADFDALIFTSSNAVRFFAERARERGVSLALVGAVLCVGPATARAALEAGMPVHLTATGRGDAEALLEAVVDFMPPRGKRFLLPQSEIGRGVLREGLRAAGGEVAAVTAYRNVGPQALEPELRKDLQAGRIGAWTFTSPSTVDRFFDLLGGPPVAPLNPTVVAAVGVTTARALRSRGIEPDVVPESPGMRELVDALSDYIFRRDQRGGNP